MSRSSKSAIKRTRDEAAGGALTATCAGPIASAMRPILVLIASVIRAALPNERASRLSRTVSLAAKADGAVRSMLAPEGICATVGMLTVVVAAAPPASNPLTSTEP